ncbi:helix-turn-helix transcriptional regulator [Paraburkholderia sp. IW21]|uniref:helix-turn-helix transcriptional regulator n=1 Tax=Paraburkholderia sp. IW21 TaxID=3242488 RepID=UPI00352120DE
MDYAIKTLSQLRPILLGFRKSAGLTQAAVAKLLGITQQSYAQLEANPASASVERLFKVMRLLNVELSLSQTSPSPSSKPAQTGTPKRQRPVPTVKKAKLPSTANRSGSTSKASSSKQPLVAITTKKKRENW